MRGNGTMRGAGRSLVDAQFERGNCGVGFVARLDGVPRHEVVEQGVRVLVNLEHRGAVGGDRTTGDGAGLLLQVPDRFLRAEAAALGIALPPAGEYGVGLVFLPPATAEATRCIALIERAAAAEGLVPLGWRDVPVSPDHLGDFSRATLPAIRQVFLGRGGLEVGDAFERKLYVVRRLAEKEAAGWGGAVTRFFCVASLSSRTLLYKGMLTGTQLLPFYPDLARPELESALALVHQRYSTNTLPSWPLSQPFRFLAHNGEINTLRGNVNRMRAREAILASPLFGADLGKITPVIQEGGSDSAMLDNALELLVLGGRSLPHAMTMLIPEAWGQRYQMSEDRRAFYEYHAAVMEPWDGPAAVAFTDGRVIGGILDRNGLRPARWTETRDGLVVLASESGVIPFEPERILRRGRLQPGRMFLVDLEERRVVPDREIKARLARQRPYRNWVHANRIELRGLFEASEIPAEDPALLRARQHAHGYTEEECRMVLAPMAARGQEAVGSMGNDAALAVLSTRPVSLFAYFKQLFAQVTNPPIDPLREELVMSLMTFIGRQQNLLDETPAHVRQLKLRQPFLAPEDMARLRRAGLPDVRTADLDMTFPAGGDGAALERALDGLCAAAEAAIAGGATILVLTDRAVGPGRAPIPALLAASGLHHHLIRRGLRNHAGIVVEGGEPREVMHFALLFGYGTNAVCPTTALATVRELAEEGLLDPPVTPTQALDNYLTAVKKGLLKTFSRMGISTLRSFFGAQTFEAVGLGEAVVARYFTGTPSRIGGLGLDGIAAEANARHRNGWCEAGCPAGLLDPGGDYHLRAGGEQHTLGPLAISRLQEAVRRDDERLFREYTALVNEGLRRTTLRGQLAFVPGTPVPLAEVEPEERILARFVAAAMSFGSISQEAHEAIAIAANRVGARSNCGEGGEDPARAVPLPNGDSRRSRVRQVASGRFGVTLEYLRGADELQIKVAQGAKPGEGGQLPGHKVSRDIARVRHTTPYVTLISPPPHHDIYSIEDLAQLIFDLKVSNPAARVSVKLVSEVGVGTIASGVAKAKADLVLISGADGGTGASPLTAIKHCGLPWELGLAEAQQSLIANRLRDRIRVQVDGQLRTGRDLAIAALLGAEEFGFGTVLLVALGCVMMRKCHLNTCPVGVATQDPELRRRFGGAADHVERFFRFLARDLRRQMAELGFRTVDEMVGRTDRLTAAPAAGHPKAGLLDLLPLIRPQLPPGSEDFPRRGVRSQEHALAEHFDHELIRRAAPALERGEPVRIALPVRNVHRTVGTLLAGEVLARHGAAGLPDGTIEVTLAGSVGQSAGAFLCPGVTLRVEGDANDYLGKGLSGGRVIVVPPAGATFVPHQSTIAGNVILYGATGGEVFLNGRAGERFAVRNSGATAVVEGVGDHGCEYMTGGTVVVLGRTGVNFAAGMSGGVAYVYDETGLFDTRCNLDMVDLEGVWIPSDQAELRTLIARHLALTGSAQARMILDNWQSRLPYFVKVMPIEYRTSLERMRREAELQAETVSATEEVFEGRAEAAEPQEAR